MKRFFAFIFALFIGFTSLFSFDGSLIVHAETVDDPLYFVNNGFWYTWYCYRQLMGLPYCVVKSGGKEIIKNGILTDWGKDQIKQDFKDWFDYTGTLDGKHAKDMTETDWRTVFEKNHSFQKFKYAMEHGDILTKSLETSSLGADFDFESDIGMNVKDGEKKLLSAFFGYLKNKANNTKKAQDNYINSPDIIHLGKVIPIDTLNNLCLTIWNSKSPASMKCSNVANSLPADFKVFGLAVLKGNTVSESSFAIITSVDNGFITLHSQSRQSWFVVSNDDNGGKILNLFWQNSGLPVSDYLEDYSIYTGCGIDVTDYSNVGHSSYNPDPNVKIPTSITCFGGQLPDFSSNSVNNSDDSKNNYNNLPYIDFSKILTDTDGDGDYDAIKTNDVVDSNGNKIPDEDIKILTNDLPAIQDYSDKLDTLIDLARTNSETLQKILDVVADTGFSANSDGKISSKSNPWIPLSSFFRGYNFRSKFPFCLPFDVLAILSLLKAEPIPPRIDIPVLMPDSSGKVKDIKLSDDKLNVTQGDKISIDFSGGIWLQCAKILKYMIFMAFCVGFFLFLWKVLHK